MSVLIRGMEMPKSCDECPLYTCMHNHDNCPLVPVPEHGRLIDADALMEEFRLPKDLLDPAQVLMHITGVRVAIQTAPTIISAEEGEA